VAADDHERLRMSRLIRCASRIVRLRSVVKLHCSPTTSGSNAASREARLLAVDAEIEHLALVPVGLEASRDANRTQRLDKRQHLQAEDSRWGFMNAIFMWWPQCNASPACHFDRVF